MNCPNKALPAYKELVRTYGDAEALGLFIANGEEIPTLDEARQIYASSIDKSNINVSHSDTELKPVTQKRLDDFLSKRGIDILDLDRSDGRNLAEQWGLSKKAMVRGVADTTKGIIGIVSGFQDVEFGEEAGHMTFAMLKGSNPKLANEMFKQIGKYEIFDKVLKDPGYIANKNYRLPDGKPDIMALKEEAIGKLIKEHLANETGQDNKLEDFQKVLEHESPENVSKFQIWFSKALEWFKQLFNKYDDNPFKEVAKQMLGTSKHVFKGTSKDLSRDGRTFASVGDETANNIERVDKLRQVDATISHVDGKFKLNDKDIRFKPDDTIIGMKGKGAQELADKGKLDMKDIFDRYIGEDGLPKKNEYGEISPDVKTSISNIDPRNDKAYSVLERHILDRILSFPKDTRFVHDTDIYNGKPDSTTNGKAAHIDLMAITPDGTAHLFKYDFVRDIANIQDGEITLDQKNAIRNYLAETKGILKAGYGISKFGQARGIPIRVAFDIRNSKTGYREDSIEIGGVKSTMKDKPYLRPIPTFDERTGDTSVDKLIDKFLDLYKSKDKSSDTDNKRGVLNSISRSIQHMQIDLGAPILNAQIKSAVDIATRATKDFIDAVKTLSPKDMSKEELAKKASSLNMRENDLITYQDSYLHYKDKVKTASDEEKIELDKLKDMSDKTKLALFELQDARRQFADFALRHWDVMGGVQAEKELGIWGRQLTPFNDPKTAAQTGFYRMKTETNRTIETRMRPMMDRLSVIKGDIDEWLKGRDYKDFLGLLKEKNDKGERTNKLIKQYSSEFYEQWDEREEKLSMNPNDVTSKTWMRQNIDMVAFKKWMEQRREKKRDEINADFPPSVRRMDSMAQQEWAGAMKNNNKYNSIANDNSLIQFGKKFPKDDWKTKEFEELQKPANAAVKKYYDFIQEVNGIAAESGYIQWDRAKRFLPFIFKTLNESVALGSEYSFANQILRSMTVSDLDINYGQINGITNEKYESLPKYFTYEMEGKNVSEDLIPNTELFLSKVIEYDENRKIEPLVKTLLWLEKSKDSLQTNWLGRVIEGSDPKHDNTKNYEAFKDIVSHQFYGKSYTNKADVVGEANAGESYNKFVGKVNKFVGFKALSTVDEGGRYSLIKTMDAVKNIQMLKTLGVNVSVPLYRMLSTNGQAIIQAGEYYNHKELGDAELRHGGLQFNNQSGSLHVLMMKNFFPVEGQLHTEIRRLSMSKLTRDSLPDLMMKLTQRAHDWIQYINYDAMMHNAAIIDGKVVNARQYVRNSPEYAARYDANVPFDTRRDIEKTFEDKVSDLIAKNGLINKAKEIDGKLVVEGLDLNDESVVKYMGMTRNMGLKLSGNITKENEVNARRNAFIRQFFMYKSWLLGMIESRYKPLAWKEGAEAYEWGRIRMVAKIASENIFSSVGRMTSMLRGTDKGVKYMSDLYDKKKAEYEDSTGKEFMMNRPQFYDMIRRNIQQEVKEVSAQMILLGGVIAMYSAVKEADKDKKGVLAFGARVMDRSFEELNMYYNPISMQNIANGSLLPSLGFPIDITTFTKSLLTYGLDAATDDKKGMKGAHLLKHTAKLFPLVSQIPNWTGVFFPEYMKQFGYTPDAKQVHH